MDNCYLDKLVDRGELKEYQWETIEDIPGSGMRETDRLTLTLPSGSQIIIDTFCSGCAENTALMIDTQFSE